MNCQVSHYVSHLDEEQTIAQYDYFWCNIHHCKCGSNGCEAVEQSCAVDVGTAPIANDEPDIQEVIDDQIIDFLSSPRN